MGEPSHALVANDLHLLTQVCLVLPLTSHQLVVQWKMKRIKIINLHHLLLVPIREGGERGPNGEDTYIYIYIYI